MRNINEFVENYGWQLYRIQQKKDMRFGCRLHGMSLPHLFAPLSDRVISNLDKLFGAPANARAA